MGCHKNITADNFPRQSDFVGKATSVCFHYGLQSFPATIVRDDLDAPFIMIFKLEDGRHVLSTECQYRSVAFDVDVEG